MRNIFFSLEIVGADEGSTCCRSVLREQAPSCVPAFFEAPVDRGSSTNDS